MNKLITELIDETVEKLGDVVITTGKDFPEIVVGKTDSPGLFGNYTLIRPLHDLYKSIITYNRNYILYQYTKARDLCPFDIGDIIQDTTTGKILGVLIHVRPLIEGDSGEYANWLGFLADDHHCIRISVTDKDLKAIGKFILEWDERLSIAKKDPDLALEMAGLAKMGIFIKEWIEST